MRSLYTAIACFPLLVAVPAIAAVDQAPSSGTCAAGNGSSCAGNEAQADSSDGIARPAPAPFTIARPPVSGRTAYISQVGDENRARIEQIAENSFAEVRQTGDANRVLAEQSGTAANYASLLQSGNRNSIAVLQDGAVSNVALLHQSGQGNRATVTQMATSGTLGLDLTQTGQGNTVVADQSGGDNHARLVQTGDFNAMNFSQSGEGNRLVWTQDGDHLSQVRIELTGNTAMQITQSN